MSEKLVSQFQNSQTNLQLLLTAAVIGFHVPYDVWSFPLSSGALKNYYLTGKASFILLLLLPRKNLKFPLLSRTHITVVE